MFVFKLYGSSGQGVETATRILGRAGFLSGFNVQDFSFSGRERRGACVTGTVKMDKDLIQSRQDEKADFLIIMDTGLELNNIIKDTKEGGIVLFNSDAKINNAYLKKHKIKNYHVSATEIAMENIKSPKTNTAMLGALAKLFGKISLKNIKKGAESELGESDTNNRAIDEGYRGVKK